MPHVAWRASRSPSRLIPRLHPGLDFGVITRHSGHFTGGIAFARLPDSHLTPSGDAFCRNAHHPGHRADAACGGLEPPPTRRLRGAYPISCTASPSDGNLYDMTPSVNARGTQV